MFVVSFKFSMATSENTVLMNFNVQLRSKQIVPWTILPVDRVNTIVLFVCQNSRIELVCVIYFSEIYPHQGHLKKMFWFSDNGFQKKGKVGWVFYFLFLFPIQHGKGFYILFLFSAVYNNPTGIFTKFASSQCRKVR
jgi:hypothetical protein